MSVSVDEFTKEGGLLNWPAMWPGEAKSKVTARLTTYLQAAPDMVDGYADLSSEAQQDRATRLYVTMRAWDHVVERLIGLPSTVEAQGEGSSSYLVTQIDLAKEKRDAAQAELESMVALDVDSEAETFQTLRSLRD